MSESANSLGNSKAMTRRSLLASGAGAALAGAALSGAPLMSACVAAEPKNDKQKKEVAGKPIARKGRIKQSVVQWCFNQHWDVEQTIKIASRLGCGSVELIAPMFFPTLKKYGLECAIGSIDMGPDPPFVKGFNNPKHWDKVRAATRGSIDSCAAFGYKNVISFTGMRDGIPDDVGADNCVKHFKQVVGHAEKNNVTLCLEMLNTRDDSHPMKGHPGYQGDHTEYCIDIIKRVGSPNLKLLFDIYHVQIMDGDVIRRIRQHKDYIGHVHTAGNPGRGELNDKQEINYKPIMEALVDIGYEGYVGQEFIPVGDPLVGLRQAVALCDV